MSGFTIFKFVLPRKCIRCSRRHEGRLSPGRRNSSASHRCSAAPLCAARPDPPWYFQVLDSTGGRKICVLRQRKFPDIAYIKRVYRDETAPFHWSAARNAERFSSCRYTGDKPRMNRLSTTNHGFPDMPCMKRVYRDKKASFHCSAARNKARFSSR